MAWLKTEKSNIEADIKSLPWLAPNSPLAAASTHKNPLLPHDALVYINAALAQKELSEGLISADEEAKSQGYESAADMLATKDVEKEWYHKKYGADTSARIEAYKQLEREKFGRTSFEAAMAGEHDPQFLGQGVGEESAQALEHKKEEMAAQIEAERAQLLQQQQLKAQQEAATKEQKQKQQTMLMIGGAAALVVVAYLALRK